MDIENLKFENTRAICRILTEDKQPKFIDLENSNIRLVEVVKVGDLGESDVTWKFKYPVGALVLVSLGGTLKLGRNFEINWIETTCDMLSSEYVYIDTHYVIATF